jgi:hypothetical protein
MQNQLAHIKPAEFAANAGPKSVLPLYGTATRRRRGMRSGGDVELSWLLSQGATKA